MPYELSDKGAFLQIRFYELFESNDFVELFRELNVLESQRDVTPHRITLLSDVKDFVFQFSHMLPIAKDRAKHQLKNKIKSAIVAYKPVELALANLMLTMNSNPNITIKIFPNISEAEIWLNLS